MSHDTSASLEGSPMPLDTPLCLNTPMPHIKDPVIKSCSCCGHQLDFQTYVQISNGSVFGKVWALKCGHLVDSQCTFLLLTHTSMHTFLLSVLSRCTRGWTIAPGHSGQVEAMKPAYSHTPDGLSLFGLAELEEFILKFRSLLQGLECWQGSKRNSRPLSVEFMMDWSKRHVPPIAAAISAAVANLLGTVRNGRMVNPSHLHGEHLVLVAPGFLTVRGGGEYKRHVFLDWLIPRQQPTWSSVDRHSELVAKSKAVLEEQKRWETEATESMLQMLKDVKIDKHLAGTVLITGGKANEGWSKKQGFVHGRFAKGQAEGGELKVVLGSKCHRGKGTSIGITAQPFGSQHLHLRERPFGCLVKGTSIQS
ncbi:hypothetical protein F5146DRAFT_1002587 [Armillaria mellea]|nr:hypothetical protein F5146DRAFT_1002587 [Armillaria mellea]